MHRCINNNGQFSAVVYQSYGVFGMETCQCEFVIDALFGNCILLPKLFFFLKKQRILLTA